MPPLSASVYTQERDRVLCRKTQDFRDKPWPLRSILCRSARADGRLKATVDSVEHGCSEK
ncbi:hypothetical protein GCM10009095_33250 [Sphingomonas molluscorum]